MDDFCLGRCWRSAIGSSRFSGAAEWARSIAPTTSRLGQPVAFKFLPEEAANDPALLERFRDEVRIARKVSHPNVCRVYDVGEVEGQTYSLDGVCRRRRPGVAAAADRTAAERQSARDRAPALRRTRGSACQRRAASRSEARQHHARWTRTSGDHRLWTGCSRRPGAGRGGAQRNARLHGARATGRQRGHREERHLLAGPGAVRNFHRQARLQRRQFADLVRSRAAGDISRPSSFRQGSRPAGRASHSALPRSRSRGTGQPTRSRWRPRCRVAIHWPPRWLPAKRLRRRWSPPLARTRACSPGSRSFVSALAFLA